MEKEVRRALWAMADTYSTGRRIGSGSYGVVYEVFSIPDGVPYAAKFIVPGNTGDGYLNDDAIREMRAITTHVPSEYLITCSRVLIFTNYTTCLLMKRYDCTLADMLKASKLAYSSVLSVFFQLVCALGALHAAGTCHRDVKPENILVDLTAGGVVLADLGVAKNDVQAYYDGRCLTGIVATCGYAPIETLLPIGRYTTAMDVWSLGVIVYEMLAGRNPFAICTDRAAHVKIILGTHGVPPACCNCVTETCCETECALNFLKNTCCQVVGKAATASRLPGALTELGVDEKVCELVFAMLQYVPERRPSVQKIAEASVLAGFTDSRETRTLTEERAPQKSGRAAIIPVLPPLSYTTLPLQVMWAFEPLQSPHTRPPAQAATAVSKKWIGDGPDFIPRLTYLLDFYLHEHTSNRWCVEAWLLGMETCRMLRGNTLKARPDTVERVAAYLQYGLALASPTQPDPPYCRYDWIVRIPVRVLDVCSVGREEARLVAELCGRAPRVNPSEWQYESKICREFFEATL